MPRSIWSISEYNVTTRDSLKRTLKSGPFVRERRGSRPEKQQPKHNPCRLVGRNWKDHVIPVAGNHRQLDTRCLAKVHLIVWNPKGIPTRSMENMKWYSSSQVLTAKHVSYPQLSATLSLSNVTPRLGMLPLPGVRKKRITHFL